MPLERIIFDYSAPRILRIKLSGEWLISAGLPSVNEVTSQLTGHKDITQITFDLSQVSKWDSGLVSFLLQLIRESGHRSINVAWEGMPQGVQKLLTLALKVNDKVLPREIVHEPFYERVGERVIKIKEGVLSLLDFLGEITFSFGRLITGKAYFSRDGFIYTVQRCGVDALPLVSLISIL
ncbi:MAG: STAS domain-containing protein, partial [Candidatus Omnitrophota bacterium]